MEDVGDGSRRGAAALAELGDARRGAVGGVVRVVGTLWIALSRVSLSVMMRSVKVPPTSTPISFMECTA